MNYKKLFLKWSGSGGQELVPGAGARTATVLQLRQDGVFRGGGAGGAGGRGGGGPRRQGGP